MASETVQVIDIANLFVALVSFITAVIALHISKRVAAISISRTFLIQELYEIYERIHAKVYPDDIVERAREVLRDVEFIKSKRLILEQSGFGAYLMKLDIKEKEFWNIKREYDPASAQNEPTKEYVDKYIEALLAMSDQVQAVHDDLEPRLRKVLHNPLKDIA